VKKQDALSWGEALEVRGEREPNTGTRCSKQHGKVFHQTPYRGNEERRAPLDGKSGGKTKGTVIVDEERRGKSHPF